MATEELQDALAGINIADDDDRSDVSMEQRIADEIVSIASSAAAMEREALEQRVVELETQLLRANAQRTAARAATAAELRNQAIIENGDPAVAAHVRSYQDWVRTTGAKVAAGMGGGTVPQTPE
jgi:U3 small nucleolar RNA-associated protein 14